MNRPPFCCCKSISIWRIQDCGNPVPVFLTGNFSDIAMARLFHYQKPTLFPGGIVHLESHSEGNDTVAFAV